MKKSGGLQNIKFVEESLEIRRKYKWEAKNF